MAQLHSHHHRQQPEEELNLEEYSIEAPTPTEFLAYDNGSSSRITMHHEGGEVQNIERVEAGEHHHHDHNDDTEQGAGADEFVRHGRSPRFWLLVVGTLIVVIAAVGGGIGAAMSSSSSSGGGGTGDDSIIDSSSRPNQSGSGSHSSSSTASHAAAVEEEVMEEVFQGVAQESKENKQTSSVGGIVNLANSNAHVHTATTTTTTGSTAHHQSPSDVFDIILTHARYHGMEFQDPQSYQSLAAQWVVETAQLGVHTTRRLIQRYALACIYFATNGVENVYTKEIFTDRGRPTRKWIDETGWLDYDNECTWYRVTCNEYGWVTKIELYSNYLTGSFPPETALLQDSLEVMDLYQNMIHNAGDAGNKFLGELRNLRELFFGRTYFEYDGIPTAIGSLTKLEEFDCSYTLYNGPLDGDAFKYLHNLEYLNIGGNRYNSSIPWELSTLPKLEYFYAEYADISGDLSFVQNMKDVVELWIDRNPMIKGTIPTEISFANSLQSFSVTACSISGTIPTEMASLKLQQFWAYNNSLTGTIPAEFGGLIDLVRLGLEGNDLKGRVPEGLCEKRETGRLEKLAMDCQAGGPVFCPCCTCCGPECSGAVTTSGGKRN